MKMLSPSENHFESGLGDCRWEVGSLNGRPSWRFSCCLGGGVGLFVAMGLWLFLDISQYITIQFGVSRDLGLKEYLSVSRYGRQ
jgi:hypothetical protein